MRAGKFFIFVFIAAAAAGALWALSHSWLAFVAGSAHESPGRRVVPPQLPPMTPFAQSPMPTLQNTGRLSQRDVEEKSP